MSGTKIRDISKKCVLRQIGHETDDTADFIVQLSGNLATPPISFGSRFAFEYVLGIRWIFS